MADDPAIQKLIDDYVELEMDGLNTNVDIAKIVHAAYALGVAAEAARLHEKAISQLQDLAREIGTVSSVAQRPEHHHKQMIKRLDEWRNRLFTIAALIEANARPNGAEETEQEAARAASPQSREDRLVTAMWACIDYLKAQGHPFATWPDSLKWAFSDAIIDPRPPTEAEIQRTRELLDQGAFRDEP